MKPAMFRLRSSKRAKQSNHDLPAAQLAQIRIARRQRQYFPFKEKCKLKNKLVCCVLLPDGENTNFFRGDG